MGVVTYQMCFCALNKVMVLAVHYSVTRLPVPGSFLKVKIMAGQGKSCGAHTSLCSQCVFLCVKFVRNVCFLGYKCLLPLCDLF